MTERKGLKKIVRERMERTGEAYTTAHRVVAGRRPLPDGVVEGYPAFGGGRHHPSALVRHLLAQAGLPLSEAMVCGLGGGVGFLYAVFEYRAVPHPLLTIVAQHHPQPWAPTVLDHLRVPYTEQHSTATPAALVKLRACLDRGRPALCTVDRGRLPWHRPGQFDSSADPYPVVVAGRRDDTLLVDDHADRPHAIPLDEFGAAWAAHRKGRHALLAIDPGPLPEPDLRSALAAAVGLTVAHLTGPVLGNAFDTNMGLRGMAKLAADLREPRAKTGWSRRFGGDDAFAHATRRLDECLQREYTAADATRPIYADFLDEAAGLMPTVDAQGAAVLFRESGQHWGGVTALARAADAGTDRPALFAALAEHVEAASAAESAAASRLG